VRSGRAGSRISISDVRRAAAAGAGLVRETPALSSHTLSERTGVRVLLKAESLQRSDRRAAECARLLDKRRDHAALLVGLRVPLDAEHKPAAWHLDRLGQVV